MATGNGAAALTTSNTDTRNHANSWMQSTANGATSRRKSCCTTTKLDDWYFPLFFLFYRQFHLFIFNILSPSIAAANHSDLSKRAFLLGRISFAHFDFRSDFYRHSRRRSRTLCGRNASATVCPARAHCAPVGANCPSSVTWPHDSKKNSTELPRLFQVVHPSIPFLFPLALVDSNPFIQSIWKNKRQRRQNHHTGSAQHQTTWT